MKKQQLRSGTSVLFLWREREGDIFCALPPLSGTNGMGESVT